MRSDCDFCRPVRLVEPDLHFACPACGERMLLVAADGIEHVYHCAACHGATLLPSPAQVAQAQAARN